jgi:hypothetical protein
MKRNLHSTQSESNQESNINMTHRRLVRGLCSGVNVNKILKEIYNFFGQNLKKSHKIEKK